MSLRSPICPSSHKEKKMSDAELDEGTPITLEDAAYVARDGIILLECVNGIDDARAGRGELTVHTDTGSFNLRVDLPTEQSPAKLRENRSEEHTSELQSLMRISYAVFCLKKKT